MVALRVLVDFLVPRRIFRLGHALSLFSFPSFQVVFGLFTYFQAWVMPRFHARLSCYTSVAGTAGTAHLLERSLAVIEAGVVRSLNQCRTCARI